MTTRRYTQLDVVGSRPGAGNPLAVVHDAADLDDAAMQAFAAWTNLSETVFFLPPTQAGADYRIRIFTPRSELPFAGHPSVGAAWAALDAGLARERERARRAEEIGAANALVFHPDGTLTAVSEGHRHGIGSAQVQTPAR